MCRSTVDNIEAAYRANLAGTPKPAKKARICHAQPPKEEKAILSLPRPENATHRVKRGMGRLFVTPPLVGSWARITERGRRVSVEGFSECGGSALCDMTAKDFETFFEEVTP